MFGTVLFNRANRPVCDGPPRIGDASNQLKRSLSNRAKKRCTFFHRLTATSTASLFVEWAEFYFPLGRSSMLFATVSRGKNLGTRLLPHRFRDNRYHVSLGKDGPYIPVSDYRDIPSYLANGYSLQMSNRAENHNASLIRPESIRGWK
jgi:hypothetical protein